MNFENVKKVRLNSRTLRHVWNKIWFDNPPSNLILFFSTIIALFMFIPALYVVFKALEADESRWSLILGSRVMPLLISTFKLSSVVTLITIVVGVSLAWLINRTDLPFRNFFRITSALPLAIPPYVGALTYIIVFGPRGVIRDILGRAPFDIYSFWGVAMVMSLFTFPYVYLIVSSSIQRLNLNYEEAALSCGVSYKDVFFKIILPLLRPAIGSGALLVALYIFSDFGAIAMMRYSTFASAIYHQMTGRFDMVGSSVLSLFLMMITLILIALEGKLKRKNYTQSSKSARRAKIVPLGKYKYVALIFVLVVFTLSIVIPFSVLIIWSIRGIMNGAINDRFIGFLQNSIYSASVATIICMIVTIPLVYLKARYNSLIGQIINKMIYSGYVLPGVITSLGIVVFFIRYFPRLYSTPFIVIAAYIIRFLPQCMKSGEAAIELVPKNLDEAAKSLGKGETYILSRVIFPLIKPGILSGGALVFVNSLKELTTTLILRPAGFDTLAVRIWMEASEGFYHLAAPPALLIVLVSIYPLIILLRKD
ncbi:ABC transporter permease [Alkalithermobacter paradoxus]|uniref:Sulfate transport system permease protein CysW n=1 Tax=Alkalithermobacter paradoxus TaxID=29349 RepID=A0A1V4I8P1_9FIRM|nr:sulfate transport system permease protein CysW [[Clostridium] thermoalcaliphilum]